MENKITFYTRSALIPAGKVHTTILFPFFGNIETNPGDADYGRFDEYTREGKRFFSLTENARACDFFLLPYEFSFKPEHAQQAGEFAEEAKRLGKKVVVFFNSDIDTPVPIENAIVFRTSFFKSTQKKNELALPGWSIDFKKIVTEARELPYSEQPSLSYCGYVDYLSFGEKLNPARVLRNLRRRSGGADQIGPRLRGKALRKLIGNKAIKTNVIIRNGFWAPGMDKKQARLEYANNIFGSDYALVVRGAGNFSYRLLEVLSCGRIPVFVNTDSVLPFDDIIDWRKQVLWVEETDISRIDKMLIEYHRGMTPDQLQKKKQECRILYETWLSPLAYFSNIHKLLKPFEEVH